ncbi:hypothetical protein [Dubosiella newyorkensis]|uniref:hypothetical protein n=1 Tax=Dubosiella newyorkensis TaxID=1862672 RepID=UPI0025737045|nr:hypothetical protein [Dubosiella newyorkensis]
MLFVAKRNDVANFKEIIKKSTKKEQKLFSKPVKIMDKYGNFARKRLHIKLTLRDDFQKWC